jgi:hypothetical protein
MQVVRYATDEGQRIALLVENGTKWLHYILMDSDGIRVHKVRKEYVDKKRGTTVNEERYMTVLDYPVERAKRIFRKAAKKFNKGSISQETAAYLKAGGDHES